MDTLRAHKHSIELRVERYLYHFPSKNNIKQNGSFQCQKINLLKEKRMLNVSEGFGDGMREEST